MSGPAPRPRAYRSHAVRCLFWGGLALAAAAPGRWLLDSLTVPTLLLSLQDASAVSTPATPPAQHLLAIEGDLRPAIAAHPPSRIEWTLLLPRGRYAVETAAALDPEAWALSDGARFRLAAISGGRARQLGLARLAPGEDPGHRRWLPLSGVFTTQGDAIVLSLTTDVGEAGDGRYDRAFWEAPRVIGEPLPPPWPWLVIGLVVVVGALRLGRRAAVPIAWPLGLVHAVYTLGVGLLLAEVALRLAPSPSWPFGITAAVAGLESAAWMAATVPDEQLGYRYQPNLSVTWPWQELPAWRPAGTLVGPVTPARTQRLRTDADGFHNPRAVTDPELVVLGDSFAAGDLVDAESRLSAVLASETGSRVRDLSVSGYGPQQYAVTLRRYGLAAARPRTVVLALFEGNDVHDAGYYEEWRQSDLTWEEYTLALSRVRRESIAIPRGARSRVLAALLHVAGRAASVSPWRARVVPPPDALNPVCGWAGDPTSCLSFSGILLHRETLAPEQWRQLAGWSLTGRALLDVRRQCQRAGARLLVVLVPTKEGLLLPRLEGAFSERGFEELVRRTARGVPDDGSSSYLERFEANHGSLGEALGEWLGAQGIEFLDLRPIFGREIEAGRLPYFRFDVHWNRSGHALAARAIAAALREPALGGPH